MNNNSYEVVNEVSKLITYHDYYYKFDRFVNNEVNILLITGLPGSERDDFGKELVDKYNATYINLDIISNENNIMISKGQTNDEIGNTEITYYLNKFISNKESIKVNNQFINDFFEYLISKFKRSKKYIIEGTALYNSIKFDLIKDYPIIIKETSGFKAFVNMLARNSTQTSRIKRIKDDIKYLRLSNFEYYSYSIKKLNELKLKFSKYGAGENTVTNYKKKIYPVFILLMHSNFWLSNIIRKVTGDEYTHSAISFDSSLNALFSFARKTENNPVLAGLVREGIQSKAYQDAIPYSLYAVFVSKEEYDKMQKNIYNFFKNADKYKYNLRGLIKYVLKMNPETENKYFCSEFVALILNTDHQRTIDRPAKTKPVDLQYVDNCYLIQRGLLNQYDKNITDQKVEEILKLIKKKSI